MACFGQGSGQAIYTTKAKLFLGSHKEISEHVDQNREKVL